MIAEWRGQPVFIVRRTEEILGNLKKIEGQLSDPTSKNSMQPTYVDPETRSIKPQILLLIGICTHLGCSPRSEEHTSELQSLMRNSYAVFCLKKKKSQSTRHYK